MTIASNVNKASYSGTGAVTKRPFGFNVLRSAHPKAIISDEFGKENQLSTGYNVSIDGGFVTYPLPESGERPLANNKKITLLREVPIVQNTDLINQGPMEAEVLESAYDYLTMAVQQLNEKTNRALLGPVTSEGTPDTLVSDLMAIRAESEANTAKGAEYLSGIKQLYEEYQREIAFNGAEIGTPKIFLTGQESAGYLLMDGSSFDPTDYTDLYKELGKTVVPDWRNDPSIPEGWSWYIKGKHSANVVGQVKDLTMVMHQLQSDEEGYIEFSPKELRVDFYVPQGLQGIQGPQGPQGERGETGPQGPQGIQGIQGIQGPKGDQGERGQTGAQGVQGPQGIQGPRGEQGEVGPQGPQGIQGEKGERGERGLQGAKGPDGDKGAPGDPPIGLSFGAFEYDDRGHLIFSAYQTSETADNVTAAFDEKGHVIIGIETTEGSESSGSETV